MRVNFGLNEVLTLNCLIEYNMKRFLVLILLCSFAFVSRVSAGMADLSLRAQDIRFSTNTLIVGDDARVYVTVKNIGDVDVSGYVAFYLGSDLIGSSQVVTLVANGANEEVWADFTVPSGSFNIRVELKGTDPEDQNSTNDNALSPLYTAIEDADDDSIDDSEDNCVNSANADQVDTDGDGEGNACDSDDDNDGLSDEFEQDIGTNIFLSDTDDDGVSDAQDAYPLDSNKQEDPIVNEVEEFYSIPVALNETPDVVNDDAPNNIDADNQAVFGSISDSEQVDSILSRIPIALLQMSTNASFVYTRKSWKTYEFELLAAEGSYQFLTWDFGDSTTSAEKTVVHEFRGPGEYIVKVEVVDNDSNIVTDTEKLTISFFHIQNRLVQIMLAALLITCLLLLTLYTKARLMNKQSSNKKISVKEPEVISIRTTSKRRSNVRKK